ncbi:MAG: hypothetical protein ACREJD_11390 [Phycisphaerales bacterium]
MPRPATGAYINASPALLALRRGAVFSALVVAVAIIAQTLTFAFVHFTEIRFETAAAEKTTHKEALAVVDAQPRKVIDPAERDKDDSAPRVLGKADVILGAVSSFACGAGIVALVVLVAQCWMAIAIVAGAGVAGMHRAVRAANIVTAIFAMAIPWSSAVPAAPIWGVFCGYPVLISASSAAALGSRSELLVITLHALLPIILLALLVWAVANLSVGISSGILKHAIDPVVEAEIAAVQEHGAGSLYAVRSSGDLNRAIAAPTLVAPIRIAGDNEADRAMAELEKLAGRRRPSDEPLKPTGTDPLRRPI